MDTVIRQAVWIRNPRRILRCARIQRPWQMKPTPNAVPSATQEGLVKPLIRLVNVHVP